MAARGWHLEIANHYVRMGPANDLDGFFWRVGRLDFKFFSGDLEGKLLFSGLK